MMTQYQVKIGSKTVSFHIDFYFEDGVAVACFSPDSWTPENLALHTSLEFADAIAKQYSLDVEQVHEALIDVLIDDEEPVDIAADLRESLRDLREGRTYPIEELWQQVYSDDETD